uniref:Uncharacterized protein n=1 Tax=Arundo donax TaxID=35708 RepID=A0A0A9GMB4_ARUDO
MPPSTCNKHHLLSLQRAKHKNIDKQQTETIKNDM